MKIIVDSNIVFSAILNTRSNIGQIFTIGSRYFEFYTSMLLRSELLKHKHKIQNISGYSDIKFTETYNLITSRIRFIDEILMSDESLKQALELTKEIDENDTLFVALAIHTGGDLWTGDKKLEQGLRKKGFNQIISSKQMFEEFVGMELKHKRGI